MVPFHGGGNPGAEGGRAKAGRGEERGQGRPSSEQVSSFPIQLSADGNENDPALIKPYKDRMG